MPRNKVTDLNNHLFAQLEKLGEDDISSENLEIEINRSKAIVSVAQAIIDSNRVTVEAMQVISKSGGDISKMGGDILSIGTVVQKQEEHF